MVCYVYRKMYALWLLWGELYTARRVLSDFIKMWRSLKKMKEKHKIMSRSFIHHVKMEDANKLHCIFRSKLNLLAHVIRKPHGNDENGKESFECQGSDCRNLKMSFFFIFCWFPSFASVIITRLPECNLKMHFVKSERNFPFLKKMCLCLPNVVEVIDPVEME